MSDQAAKELGNQIGQAFAVPLNNIANATSGSIDLLYCSGSFRHMNDRWPTNYADLRYFVDQSGGYLVLGQYDRVEMSPLPGDGLEIRFLRPGSTNEAKLTIRGEQTR